MGNQDEYHAARLELAAETASILEGAREIIGLIASDPTWNGELTALGQVAVLLDVGLGHAGKNLEELTRIENLGLE